MTDEAILRCFSVMSELRPHLVKAEFVERVRTQERDGFKLAFLEKADEVVAVTGYRFMRNLAWGHFCYVDDLVTVAAWQGKGCGQEVLEWLFRQASELGCDQVHLDSGLQRVGAHAFYETQGMLHTSKHFAFRL